MKKKLTQTVLKNIGKPEKTYDLRDTTLSGLLMRVRPSGNHSYCYQYRNSAGKQQTVTLGKVDTLTPSQARDRAIEIRVAVNTGIDPQRERRLHKEMAKNVQERTGLAYKNSEDYGLHLDKREKRSADAALKSLSTHFDKLLMKPLVEIHPKDVEIWRRSMRQRGRAESTIQRTETELKLFVKHAKDDGWIDHNPLASLKPLKQAPMQANQKTRYLLTAERKRLMAALAARQVQKKLQAASGAEWLEQRGYSVKEVAPSCAYFDHLEPMILLSLHTGMRRGELFSLKWEDVGPKQITLNGTNTKNGRSRTIQLNSVASDVLTKWRHQTESNNYVFSNKGAPFITVKKAFGALLETAKIVNFRWHDMRHDFASQLVIKGVPLNHVRELLGHSDIKMTLRYAHLSDNSKADAVAVLEELA